MVKSYCLAGLSMQFRACLLRTSSLTVLEGHGSFKHHCIHCSKNPTSSQSHAFPTWYKCRRELFTGEQSICWWLRHGEKHSEEGIGTHTNNSQCDYGSYIVLKSCAFHMTSWHFFFWIHHRNAIYSVCVWKACYLVHLLMSVECPTAILILTMFWFS